MGLMVFPSSIFDSRSTTVNDGALVFPSSIFDSRSTTVNDGPLVFLLPTTYLSFLSFDFVRCLIKFIPETHRVF